MKIPDVRGPIVKRRRASIAVSCLAMLAADALAQARAEKVEVTGSHLRRADWEGPAPVTVLSRQDLERRAAQNLSEILTALPYATGSFTEAQEFGNSFAPGTSGVSLHGLGVKSTLVLLNGRRIVPYAFAQDITTTFVDLNSIPLSAIERIEVLRDGASAIYGSDALAGVVNIILRRDFLGVEARAGYAAADRGDAHEGRATLIAGSGSLSRDRYNLMASLEYYRRDPLYGRDRDDWTSSADTRAYGGTDDRSTLSWPGTWLTDRAPVPVSARTAAPTPFPECAASRRVRGFCVFDFRPDVMTLAETQRASAFLNARMEAAWWLSLFAQASFMDTRTWRQLAASGDSFVVPAGHVSNPYPFPVQLLYRFEDVGPRRTRIDAQTRRIVVGANATVGRWDWDMAWLHGRVDTRERGFDFIDVDARNRLVATNRYDFVNPSRNDSALTAGLRAFPERTGGSELSSWDARVAGHAWSLPAGPVGLAAGLEWRRESLRDIPDARSRAGLVAGAGSTRVDAERSARAVFGELSLPIARRMEAQVAARRDEYDLGIAKVVPKYALAWRAGEDMLLRAGYNRGFRAPSLPEMHVAPTVTFGGFVDSPRCAAYRRGLPAMDPRVEAACIATSRRVSLAGNPALRPEHSRAWTSGLVWSPGPASIAIDLYDIRIRDRVQALTPQSILDNESLFPGAVNRLPPGELDVAIGAPGPLAGGEARPQDEVAIAAGYFNATSARTRGVDLEGKISMDAGAAGRWDMSSLNNFVDVLEFTLAPGAAPVSRAGFTGGSPRYRGTHTVAWRLGAWDASATAHVVGRHSTSTGVHVDTWTTVDLQAAWRQGRYRLVGGVRNVGARDPPYGLPFTFYSVAGRTLYVRVLAHWR